MRMLSDVLLKWVSASLLVAIPLLVYISGITPDQLQLEIESPVAYTISVETDSCDIKDIRSEYRAGSSELGRVVFNLGGQSNRSHIGLSFKTEPCILIVRSVAYRSGLLWTHRLDLSKANSYFSAHGDIEIVDAQIDALRLKFSGKEGTLTPKSGYGVAWRMDFGGRKVLKVFLLAVFAAMLVLSLFAALRGKDKVPWRRAVCQSAAVSLFAGVFYRIVLPVQSYLVNRSDFGFRLVDLLNNVSFGFLAVSLGLTAILLILSFFWGRFFHVVLTAFLIYEYLETGILSIGLPALNGEIGYFTTHVARGVVDVGILVAIVGLAVLLWHRIKELIHWVALAFLALSALSVFDVHSDPRMSSGMEDAVIRDFSAKEEVAKSAVYSRKRNLMVFVLDMVSSEVAEDIMRQDDGLKAKFDGFTCYRNNVGMHMCTEVGSAGMLTGRYFENPATLTDYVYSIFGSNSVLFCYAKADIPVYSLPGAMKFGYTNRPQGGNTKSTSEKVGKSVNCLDWRMEDQQKWTLSEIVRFRATPFIVKAIMFGKIVGSWPSQGDIHDESQLYPIIAESPVVDDCYMTFHWYHTTGGHPPLHVDRFGHAVSEARFDYYAHREKAWYAMRLLGDLFDQYRAKGVYDNSTIIVCADHAASFENGNAPIKNGLPTMALPMLWVKPANAHGPATESDLPTSHSKLAELIRVSRFDDLTKSGIESILKTDNRLFREAAGKGLWDWHVDADGVVQKNEISLMRSADALKPLVLGRLYSFSAKDKGEKADVVFEDIDWSGAGRPRILGNTRTATLRFKVATTICSVRLKVRTLMSQTGGQHEYSSDDPRFEIYANGGNPVRVTFDEKTEKAEIELKDVKPNPEGIVELRFAREGFNEQVFLDGIEVAEK